MATIIIPIEDHPETAQLVGIYAAHFASMEDKLFRIFAHLLGANFSAAAIVFHEIGGRRRREVVKQLAANSLSPELAERLRSFLDGKFKTSAERRNDLVHDHWVSDGTKLHRMDPKTYATDPMPVNQIRVWVEQVKIAHLDLMGLSDEILLGIQRPPK